MLHVHVPVILEPDTELINAQSSDLGPYISAAVHKDTREESLHEVLQLHFVLLQLCLL